MKDVLYVPGLKKNLPSIWALDKKGFGVAFIDGEVLMCPRVKYLEDSILIGIEEGGVKKLKGHLEEDSIHDTKIPCELWHRMISHIKYKAHRMWAR